MQTTRATYLSASPARRTWISAWFSTTCALVTRQRARPAAFAAPGGQLLARRERRQPRGERRAGESASSPRAHGIVYVGWMCVRRP